MNKLRHWLSRKVRMWLIQEFGCEPHERICGAVELRGVMYIITDCRILRFSPGNKPWETEISQEGYTR